MIDEAIVVLVFISLIPIGLLIYCWYTLRLNRCEESCCRHHGGYCCPDRGATRSARVREQNAAEQAITEASIRQQAGRPQQEVATPIEPVSAAPTVEQPAPRATVSSERAVALLRDIKEDLDDRAIASGEGVVDISNSVWLRLCDFLDTLPAAPQPASAAKPDVAAWNGNADGLTMLLEENKRLRALADRQMNDAEQARLELAEFKAPQSETGRGETAKELAAKVRDLLLQHWSGNPNWRKGQENTYMARIDILCEQVLRSDGGSAKVPDIPTIIRRSTWRTPELRESAARLVANILRSDNDPSPPQPPNHFPVA